MSQVIQITYRKINSILNQNKLNHFSLIVKFQCHHNQKSTNKSKTLANYLPLKGMYKHPNPLNVCTEINFIQSIAYKEVIHIQVR